ncbi:tRNA (adenine(22)-N(1))-methyltransferase [Marinococcus luteus]|uniref:tRNA (adenine(22)-N(1))-methyltransferase n=1 Tax=Marinococcus luteus TaxID=1122204 RepID=UPI002ACC9970|nr:tRNA (adenine(22)-N(1))-methyltransferase TrmK [Marinococcus luteus]MDZ5782962.1 tRNA (adenine(22)-N(1))-methyltransferase TrmK [Marinococcus luteus]
MKKAVLSDRLAVIVEQIDQGAVVADIGTDHGLVPVEAVVHREAEHAVAADVNAGPLQAASDYIASCGLTGKIDTRLGSGLTVLKETDRIDTVVIAGMGGTLITEILEEGKAHLRPVQKLILQPNVSAGRIRQWLFDNGWKLTNERILKEDRHVYEVLTAVPGEAEAPYRENQEPFEKQLLFGPYLLKERNNAFKDKWMREKDNWQQILQQLANAVPTEQTTAKKQKLNQYIAWAEEVIT